MPNREQRNNSVIWKGIRPQDDPRLRLSGCRPNAGQSGRRLVVMKVREIVDQSANLSQSITGLAIQPPSNLNANRVEYRRKSLL